MRMKKLVALLLVCAMVMTMFAACGKKAEETTTETTTTETTTTETTTTETTTTETTTTEETAEPVTLKWYGCGNSASGWDKKVIEAWNEVHPEIQVEYTELSTVWDDNSLKNFDVMIAGGEAVDVCAFNYNLFYPRVMNGAMAPLDDAIAAAGDDFAGQFGNLASSMLAYDGEIYGVPLTDTTFKVIYNKTLFEEKGITIPENWTIQEFTEIAKQMTDEDTYGAIYAPTWSQLTYACAQTAGWDLVKYDESGNAVPNFDDPIFRETMTWLYDLTMDDTVDAAPSYAIMKAESLNRRIALAKGEAAMIVDSEYALEWLKIYQFDDPGEGALDFEIGVAELPCVNAGAQGVQHRQVSSVAFVPRTSENVEEAYMFCKFLREISLEKQDEEFLTWDAKDGTHHEDVYPEQVKQTYMYSEYESHLAQWNYDPTLAAYKALADTVYGEQYSAYFSGDMSLDDLVQVLNETCEAEFANMN